jgi:hypothetical protein
MPLTQLEDPVPPSSPIASRPVPEFPFEESIATWAAFNERA